MTTLLTCYLPDLDLQVLVTVWESGEAEIAYRAGDDATAVTWSPPVQLEEAP